MQGFYTGAGAAAVNAQYAALCRILEEIKGRGTASDARRAEILRRVRAAAEALPEGRPSRTGLRNAGDDLVEFLKHEGVPATNNFCEEVAEGGPNRRRLRPPAPAPRAAVDSNLGPPGPCAAWPLGPSASPSGHAAIHSSIYYTK